MKLSLAPFMAAFFAAFPGICQAQYCPLKIDPRDFGIIETQVVKPAIDSLTLLHELALDGAYQEFTPSLRVAVNQIYLTNAAKFRSLWSSTDRRLHPKTLYWLRSIQENDFLDVDGGGILSTSEESEIDHAAASALATVNALNRIAVCNLNLLNGRE